MGGQSMYLFWCACTGLIPATVSITANTGAERDCLWSTGKRTSAEEFFYEVIEPMGAEYGVATSFVRAQDGSGQELPPLDAHVFRTAATSAGSTHIPLFGSQGGRLMQTCTDRWKIAAIKQELRRMGADTARCAQGIHSGEAINRVKGIEIGQWKGFMTYQTGYRSKRSGKLYMTKWLYHYYPLVEWKMNREKVREEMAKLDIPYLVTSECDLCPHKDLLRWQKSSEETIKKGEELEGLLKGEFFLTANCVPLRDSIELMRESRKRRGMDEVEDFGCQNDICGI